ncbi:hypothetical protein LPB140_11970 [Sphingorhabdus lutea]|uniref:N-acetyltransferase domain-containing protein n=1 Tax=Sphingorhabdus lutea TaxID=1913578 RepID=A0A1L3JE29_9SPHN|nr:GNAT family N-acetyltransferase [Sphingorhabdus lutea]APG63385.1 hypothetical protein LPB140_11970 [Sphingorhabdus lutea]
MFARTERTLLRPSFAEDAPVIHQLMQDEALVRNLASAPWPYTLNDAQQFTSLDHDARYPKFIILNRTKSTPEIIGSAAILPTDKDNQVELGYWIARPHWNQGFATEAANAVIQIAQILGYDNIVASHFFDNPASGRVLRKLGFAPLGKNQLRYSKGRNGQELSHIYHKILAGNDSADKGAQKSSHDNGVDSDIDAVMRGSVSTPPMISFAA